MKYFLLFLIVCSRVYAGLEFEECKEFQDKCLKVNGKYVSKRSLAKLLRENSDEVPDEYKDILSLENLKKLPRGSVIKLGDLESLDIASKVEDIARIVQSAGITDQKGCDGSEVPDEESETIELSSESLKDEVEPYLKYTRRWSEIDASKKEAIVAHIASIQGNFSPDVDQEKMIANLMENGGLFGTNFLVQALVEYTDGALLMNRKELGDLVNPILKDLNPEMAKYFSENYGFLEKYGDEDVDYISLENLDKFNSAKDIILNDIKEQDEFRAKEDYPDRETVSLHSYLRAMGEGKNGFEHDTVIRGKNRSIVRLYGKNSVPILYNKEFGVHSRFPSRQAQYGLGGVEVYQTLIHPGLEIAGKKLTDKYSKYSCRVNCGFKAGGHIFASGLLALGATRVGDWSTAERGAAVGISTLGGIVSGAGEYAECKKSCIKDEKIAVLESEIEARKTEEKAREKNNDYIQAQKNTEKIKEKMVIVDDSIEKEKENFKNAKSAKDKQQVQNKIDELESERKQIEVEVIKAQNDELKAQKEAQQAAEDAAEARRVADEKKKEFNNQNNDGTYPINPNYEDGQSGPISLEVLACIKADCRLVRPGRDTELNGYRINLSGKSLAVIKEEISCEKGICTESKNDNPFGLSGKIPSAMGDDITNPGKSEP